MIHHAIHRAGVALALAITLGIGVALAPASGRAGDDDWAGLHGAGRAIDSMNLNGTTAKVAFFYHAPRGAGNVHLEARVTAQDAKKVTVGLSVWKQDVAFSDWDAKAKTLEVYLKPRHLMDPTEIRPEILQMTPFDAPAEVTTVRVVYLP